MMRVVDAHGIVHIAKSTPGPNAAGDVVAGTTACHRWWTWSSMKVGYHYGDNVINVDYSTAAPSCLGCLHG